jgi:tetratricopeptide (TPR) repeat protein
MLWAVRPLAPILAILLAAAEPEAISLLGQPLYPPALSAEAAARMQEELDEARRRFEEAPGDETAIIWLGRRLAYLGRYREAVGVYTNGLATHPASLRLLRHRGHRYITLRRLPEAVSDLARAAELASAVPDEVEPDGQPNASGVPRSTTKTNIYYHLGLANYLQGRWAPARLAWLRCLDASGNDDMRVAASYWLYLAAMRLGDAGGAAAVLKDIRPDMEIMENGAYHELLLMYKGLRDPAELLARAGPGTVDEATLRYGVGAWHLIGGRPDEALAIFRQTVQGPMWPAFGHVAAEAELARMAATKDADPPG